MSKRVQVILSDEVYSKLTSKIAETKHTESKQCAIFIEEMLEYKISFQMKMSKDVLDRANKKLNP